MSAQHAQGSGFYIWTHSSRDIGSGFSAISVNTNDASCIWFSPAGMASLNEPTLTLGSQLIVPNFEYYDDGSDYPQLGGLPVQGTQSSGSALATALVPSAFYSQPLAGDLFAGIGFNAPYGLAASYDSDWVGRYQCVESEMTTYNINPTIAWRLGDQVSLALGGNMQYASIRMKNAIDFGSILASQGVPGALPMNTDGQVEVTGDDWGVGYNAGLMYRPASGTLVGLNYRSEITYDLQGRADFNVPEQASMMQAGNYFVNTDVQMDMTVPATLALGLAQHMGDKWELTANISMIFWDCFDELRVRYDSAQEDSVVEEDWQNTFEYALGLSYAANEKWTLRCGVAYEESPIRDSYHRTPVIPDGDSIWLSAGFGYRASEWCSIDSGILHMFYNDIAINSMGATGDELNGHYEAGITSMGLQLNFFF
ncbi:MAG: outer membrane protein transport protein [Kiritimatiellae bacterium]|nr:outer membrane protein transport protein [Kiritimatiellia bacterium]